MKRYGFTLAEVLITLLIIGVVAALTIPIVFNNVQNNQLKTAFKKSYTTLSQAFDQTTLENGGQLYSCYAAPGFVYSVSECVPFWTSFKSKLNVIRDYNGPVDGVNIANYTGIDLIVAQGGHNNTASCAGAKVANKISKMAWVLSDGSMVITYGPDLTLSWSYFILDTNGLKGPNKWGYDLFVLGFYKKNSDPFVAIADTLCGSQESGGYNVIDILMNK